MSNPPGGRLPCDGSVEVVNPRPRGGGRRGKRSRGEAAASSVEGGGDESGSPAVPSSVRCFFPKLWVSPRVVITTGCLPLPAMAPVAGGSSPASPHTALQRAGCWSLELYE